MDDLYIVGLGNSLTALESIVIGRRSKLFVRLRRLPYFAPA